MDVVTYTSLIAPTASTAIQSSTGAQVVAKTLSKLPDIRVQAMQAAGKGQNVNVMA